MILVVMITFLAKQSLYCDYIYLDTDERRRFAQVSHEYLIEQVQEQKSIYSRWKNLRNYFSIIQLKKEISVVSKAECQ